MSLYVVSFWILLIASAIAAYRWGGQAERLVAVLYVAAAITSIFVSPAFELRYSRANIHLFVVDLALLCGLIVAAVRSERGWTIWAAALQIISVLAPLAEALNPDLRRLGYQLMEELVSFPMVLLLAFGVWQCRSRDVRAARLFFARSSAKGGHATPPSRRDG